MSVFIAILWVFERKLTSSTETSNLLSCRQEERLEILLALSRHMSLDGDVDLKHFATSCEHFTGADYKGLASLVVWLFSWKVSLVVTEE